MKCFSFFFQLLFNQTVVIWHIFIYRYLGEDEEKIASEKLDPLEVLKKLKNEAKARKRKLTADTKFSSENNEETQEDKGTKFSVEIEESSEQLPLKKQKKKHKAEHTEAETSDNAMDVDSEHHRKHKKKKKDKNKHSETFQDKDISDLVTDESDKHTVEDRPLDETKDKIDSDNLLMVESMDKSVTEEQNENEAELEKSVTKEGHREIGGFTVIGSVKPTKVEKVSRKLQCMSTSDSFKLHVQHYHKP